MSFSPLINELVAALRCLPGVGPKSAQRMALHILERDRQRGLELSAVMASAINNIKHCSQCRNLTEHEICGICNSARRDDSILCIVEQPSDVVAIEQAGTYQGKYFVLGGHLSPIDGIGPQQLGIDELLTTIAQRRPKEVILATNPTVEGEATAHYIFEQLQVHDVEVTRLAHGIPLGGDLDLVDTGTLMHAFNGRRALS